LEQENTALNNSVIDLKARSMRDNLIFYNIEEAERENTTEKVHRLLEEKMGFKDAATKDAATKFSNLQEDWQELKRAKNKVTAAIRLAKKKFFHQSFEENGNNPKRLWTIIRHLSGRNMNSSGVVFLEENDEHIREPLQMAEIFNAHFSNLTKNLTDSNINSYDPGTLFI
jgi:hypothetical protein